MCLRATPKDDTGLSVTEAVYGSPLTLPGELVDIPELLPDAFLWKVNRDIDGFSVFPPHHVRPVPPVQLPAALVSAKYVFVREDAVISSLVPCYRGPYLVRDRQDKYFRLQIGSKQDVVSVDRLKPVFSDAPVTTTIPPPRGRPRLNPVANSLVPSPSSTTRLPKKGQVQVDSPGSSATCSMQPLQVFKRIISAIPSGGTTVAAMKVVFELENLSRQLEGKEEFSKSRSKNM